MRGFIKNSSTFFLGFLLIFYVLNLLANCNTRNKADFTIKKDVNSIVIGHSHSECAFNDSIISNIINLSSSGESYFYTYFKLVNILEQNPTIETVYLDYTNNQVNESMNNWIWDKKHLNNKYIRYSSFIPIQDQLLLLKNNLNDYLISYAKASKKNIINFNANRYEFHSKIGGYRYLENKLEDSLVPKLIDNYFDENYDSQKYSVANINYLSQIAELCKNEKVRLVLIRTPLHPNYPGFANESTYKKILNEKLSDVEYVDFSLYKLSNDELADLEHMNYKGANRFSVWFNKLIENEMLNYPINQSLVDSLIIMENKDRY